jgi:ferredoxin-NADP reductase
LTGDRREHPLDRPELGRLVPDVAEREIYVCGPAALTASVAATARVIGIPERHVHFEEFAY